MKSFGLRKILIIFLFLFFVPFYLNSQILKAGVFGITQFPIGNGTDLFINASGGGIDAEMKFYKNFGMSVSLQGAGVIPKNENISSSWQVTPFVGLLYYIPIGSSDFAFEPMLELGLMFQGSTIKKGFGTLSNKMYVDFVLQAAPSFRFKNERILNSCLEFEFSPLLCFVPEKKENIIYTGIRLGVKYLFDK